MLGARLHVDVTQTYCFFPVQVLQTDIVMDVGQSLNPTIDIGQVEGAFVQVCIENTYRHLTCGGTECK